MKTNIRQFKYIFFIIFIMSIGIQIVDFSSFSFSGRIFQRLILIMIQGLSLIGFTHFHNLYLSKDKVKRNLQYTNKIMFVIYIVNLVYILFLDPDFGRQFTSYSTIEEYMKYNVNLKLFASIRLYVQGYQHGYVTLLTLLRNIGGNLIVFMPMAYFLPFFFKGLRKIHWFLLTIFFLVFGVELLQVLLKIGSGDIDDFFLNVFGALFAYSIFMCISFTRLYKE